jgi:hypothetical protein
MFIRCFLLLLVFLLASAEASNAAQLECRVLHRLTCAPDLCSPLDEVKEKAPLMPEIKILISADRKTLTYTEGKEKRTAVITVRVLTNNIRHVSGKIHWPKYRSDAPGAKEKGPLGSVNMLFDGLVYYWRVGYLGNKADQEYEDVLIGDCMKKW